MIRDWLQLARISNLPTCVSNVLVGSAIAAAIDPMPIRPVTGSIIAVSLLYVAGMMLNDLADLPIDRLSRPQRPLPAGRIRAGHAVAVAAALTLASLAILWWLSVSAFAFGLMLMAAIVSYNLLHHLFAPAVLFMGAARGLVYLVAGAAIAWPISPFYAGAMATSLGLYVVIVTLIARKEDADRVGSRRWLVFLLPLVVLPVAAVTLPPRWWSLVAFTAAMIIFVTGKAMRLLSRGRNRNAVMTLLAGICLVDAYFLSLLDWPMLALAALGCYIVTVLAHRRIMGT